MDVCYLPIQKAIAFDLSDVSFNWWATNFTPDKYSPIIYGYLRADSYSRLIKQHRAKQL